MVLDGYLLNTCDYTELLQIQYLPTLEPMEPKNINLRYI
jgi:hypothetical protein